MGCRDAEIGCGWVLFTPKGRYRAHMLGTAWPLKWQGGGRIWSMKVGADMPIGAVGG